jgi:hypothetical protein
MMVKIKNKNHDNDDIDEHYDELSISPTLMLLGDLLV